MNKTGDTSMSEDMLEELVGEQKDPKQVKLLDFTKLGKGHPKLNVDHRYQETGWAAVLRQSGRTQCVLEHDLANR